MLWCMVSVMTRLLVNEPFSSFKQRFKIGQVLFSLVGRLADYRVICFYFFILHNNLVFSKYVMYMKRILYLLVIPINIWRRTRRFSTFKYLYFTDRCKRASERERERVFRTEAQNWQSRIVNICLYFLLGCCFFHITCFLLLLMLLISA
jgi:hypothetical protein